MMKTNGSSLLQTISACHPTIAKMNIHTNPSSGTAHCILLWWRHQMDTYSASLALCEGNPPVTGGFPSQRPVTRNVDVFFDLRLSKRLSKQSKAWRFETPSRSLWRHLNELNSLTKRGLNEIFKCILSKMSWNNFLGIVIEVSPMLVTKGPMNNNSSLIQVMAWHRTGGTRLPEPMKPRFTNVNWTYWAVLPNKTTSTPAV